ncbi:hypothetical protein BaRGS_00021967 [Batillaria attramentaria]|uniref:Uncharacterized protein n=1 Tax=Batillaria attramentaria TaxID=370345 RepID=A0ABD0KII6_9CAEN
MVNHQSLTSSGKPPGIESSRIGVPPGGIKPEDIKKEPVDHTRIKDMSSRPPDSKTVDDKKVSGCKPPHVPRNEPSHDRVRLSSPWSIPPPIPAWYRVGPADADKEGSKGDGKPPGPPASADSPKGGAEGLSSQYYSPVHKIHELQEKARPRPGSASPAPAVKSGEGSSTPTSISALPDKQREYSKSPPTQRHLHTHHHTHVLSHGFPVPYPHDPYSDESAYTGLSDPSQPVPIFPPVESGDLPLFGTLAFVVTVLSLSLFRKTEESAWLRIQTALQKCRRCVLLALNGERSPCLPPHLASCMVSAYAISNVEEADTCRWQAVSAMFAPNPHGAPPQPAAIQPPPFSK